MRRLVRSGRIPAAVALVLACLCAGVPSTATDLPPAPVTAPGQLRVVAFGDSVTAGTACDCKPFVQLYAGLVAARTGADVTWTNDGESGQTSNGLVTDLDRRTIAADVPAATVVVVTIGANDLGAALDAWRHGGCATACMQAALPGMRSNIAKIVTRIRELQEPRTGKIVVTDYWNVFEDGQVADQDYGSGFATWSDRMTRMADAAICSAARQTRATCVDLYAPFNGSGDRDPTPLLAGDGDHPDAQGHRVIAEALAAAVMPVSGAPAGDH